ERTVGPDLGADSIHAGAVASIVGVVLVVAFMILFYGLFGVFADIALFFNLCLMLGSLSLLGATLTLPGIAWLALPMAMAVDANGNPRRSRFDKPPSCDTGAEMRPLIVIRRTPRIDFMAWHKLGFALSLLLTLSSIVLFLAVGLNYGIDFVGGTLIEVRSTSGPANLAE